MAESDGNPKASEKRLVKSYRDLELYRRCFRYQQAVYKVSLLFPQEERYSLTDQIRRSSRAIGANMAEAWSKRRYEAHFLSKLTDSDAELQETTHWLRTAYVCKYLTKLQCEMLVKDSIEVGRMLGAMIANHRRFCLPPPHDPN